MLVVLFYGREEGTRERGKGYEVAFPSIITVVEFDNHLTRQFGRGVSKGAHIIK